MRSNTWSYVRASAAALCLMAGSAMAQQPTTPKPAPAKPATPAVTPAKPAAPATITPAQPAKPDMKAPPGMPSPEDMKKMMDSMKPGAQQEQMAKSAGDWTYVNKMRMTPDAPWQESNGTAKMEMIM